MSVFFKFKSEKNFETLHLEGSHIIVGMLKEEIKSKKKISADLVIINAQTGQEYNDSDIIKKNSTLLLKRVPLVSKKQNRSYLLNHYHHCHDASHNLELVQSIMRHLSKEESVQLPLKSEKHLSQEPNCKSKAPKRLPSVDVSNQSGNPHGMKNLHHNSEEDKINEHINNCSIENTEWIPDGKIKSVKLTSIRPPSHYVCHRCKRKGHFIQNCPTNGDPKFDKPKIVIARPHGIPKSFLREIQKENVRDVLAGSSNSILLLDERLVYVSPNEAQFEKMRHLKNLSSGQNQISDSGYVNSIPHSLSCPICYKLMENAVSIPCCNETYCDSCITSALIEESNFCCLNCKTPNLSIDSLVPNQKIRAEIHHFKFSRFMSGESSGQKRYIPSPSNEILNQNHFNDQGNCNESISHTDKCKADLLENKNSLERSSSPSCAMGDFIPIPVFDNSSNMTCPNSISNTRIKDRNTIMRPIKLHEKISSICQSPIPSIDRSLTKVSKGRSTLNSKTNKHHSNPHKRSREEIKGKYHDCRNSIGTEETPRHKRRRDAMGY